MTPEDWQKVRQLYDATLDLREEERAAYLNQACGSNERLRGEVESLLAADRSAGDFLESGALADAAKALAEDKPRSLAGEQVGPYRVLALIGAGGMGEVYRAHDPRLGRDVAIKVLQALFAADSGHLRRFYQEAQAVAALNHPNILTIFDTGDHGGAPYIVSELLEGEDLRAVLNNGPLARARGLDYAQQIARGLAAAHEQGIVHRDLKPENLFVTKDGCVKILDFGLAKLRPPNGALQRGGGTVPGAVFGTVAYMSPEQVRGEDADHRADIFAFGAVLYEMLTGAQPFTGASAVELMNAILKEEPPELDETNGRIRPPLAGILRRCLAKAVPQRFQSASDLAFALESLPAGDTLPVIRNKGAARRERYLWMAASTSLLLAVLWLSFSGVSRNRDALEVTKFQVALPEQTTFAPAVEMSWMSVAPNGCCLAFVATAEGQRRLWLRRLDTLTMKEVPGTAGAFSPFWSPDSRFLAFFAEGRLKKISVSGGVPETLSELPTNASSGTWGKAGVILVGGSGADFKGIYRVAESGGILTPLLKVDQPTGFWPAFLPDGEHYLYFSLSREKPKGIYASSLHGGEARLILAGDSRGEYVAPGYLLYARDGNLVAQPFDAAGIKVTGAPSVLAERAAAFGPAGWAEFSAGGRALGYYSSTPTTFRWFNRAGHLGDEVVRPGLYETFRLGPDGRRFAFNSQDSRTGRGDVWLGEFTRGTVTRVTSDAHDHGDAVWSPDGRRLALFSFQGVGKATLAIANLDGGMAEERPTPNGWLVPSDWSPDGQYIACTEEQDYNDPLSGQNIWLVPVMGERKPIPFLRTPFDESHARFSPDGRWVAYVSNESGKPEVYVRAFDGSGEKLLVSTQGGTRPVWRRNGGELYYLSSDQQLMAVPVRTGASFDAGVPVPLFRIATPGWNSYGNAFDVASDGQRFLVQTAVPGSPSLPFSIVLNWMAELKR